MAGRKISRANMAKIQTIADHAYAMGAKLPDPDRTPIKADMSLNDQLEAVARTVYRMADTDGYCYVEETFDDHVIIGLCEGMQERYFRADYSIGEGGSVTLAARDAWAEVEEVWQPKGAAAIKAGSLIADDGELFFVGIKALADRCMELRVSWGYDGHKEQFHPERTDFDLENFPTPPLAYYHGYKADGKPAEKPIYIGKTVKRENRTDGHYLTVKLNKKPEADKVWAASLKGEAFVSPGTAGHLRRKDSDGTLTYWPIVEISAWDGAPSRKQAHPNSMGFPVLKALYGEADIPLPTALEPPEVAGDATGAVEITPLSIEDQRKVAAQIVADQLRIYRKETTK